MQVDPAQLVELAVRSKTILSAMVDDWTRAQVELADACASLGDAVGTTGMTASYAETLAEAAAVVAALTYALDLGVTGLVDAAHDAVGADDTVASELGRAATSIGRDRGPGHGGGH